MVNEVVFEPLAGGFTWILAGGTRTAIKLGRPWQKPLEALINPAKCPFCTKSQEKIDLEGLSDGWWLLPNPMTPHRKHRLIVPNKCWPAEKLQILGGEGEIIKAFEICRLATAKDNMEVLLAIHVGQLAGQNLGHPHWHVCDAQVSQPYNNFDNDIKRKDRIIAYFEEFTALASGEKPGQVQIIPNSPQGYMEFNQWTIPWLARTIAWIVELGNRKFLSSDQHLPPEFAVTVRISSDGYLRYANYCPQLSMVSLAFHHTVAAFEGAPNPMPWTHEITAAYLRE